MAEVTLQGINKSFGQTAAIKGIDLSIADGEFVVLLGPTGAGKTTTLRLIAGLEKPDAGQITIGGRNVLGDSPAGRDVAFVFQQYSLYPHLSVYENLAFPLRSPARRMNAADIDARVQEIAKMVRIAHKLQSKSTMLSGGEMQRVAIGRALVRKPSIYLMDEPLSSLDAKLRAEMRLELKRIQNELGSTLLYVTHDQIEAMTMADRIGILSAGKLVQIGTPRELYSNPSSTYVASKLGQPHINLLPVGALAAPAAPAGTRTIGIRTEHLKISKSGTPNAMVSKLEHLGDQDHIHIRIGDHNLTTLADPYASIKTGDAVTLTLNNPLYFAADGQRMRQQNVPAP
jgi:multiple sugar transport system ATP-binding protein